MKTLLITGATDGIGYETAKMLAHYGQEENQSLTLLLHGRNANKLQEVEIFLKKINPKLDVKTFRADFSSLEEVRAMAQEIIDTQIMIDTLINNAGVFVVDQDKSITKDNLDIRFQVNTIAPYILTKKILPLLTENARVINLSSAAQAPIDFMALVNQKKLSASDAYAQSKLAILMWTMDMAENLDNNPMVIAVNPKSFLGSKMVKEAYGQKGYDLKIGAEILTSIAFSDEFATAGGKYFDNDYGNFALPHPFAMDRKNRKDLVKVLNTFL